MTKPIWMEVEHEAGVPAWLLSAMPSSPRPARLRTARATGSQVKWSLPAAFYLNTLALHKLKITELHHRTGGAGASACQKHPTFRCRIWLRQCC